MNNQAELISIGSELLSGRTQNALGQILGKSLGKLGLTLVRDTTIPDNFEYIQSSIKEALRRTDIIFLSGGLGSTVDDITRDAVASLLGRPLVSDRETVKELGRRAATRGHILTEAALRQALIIDGAEVLPNSIGSAPGQKLALTKGRFIFLLPGPPNEFSAVLEENIIPWLEGRFLDARPRISREINTQGISESDIVTILEKANFQPWDIQLGFYPGNGKVDITLTTEQTNLAELEEAVETLNSLLQHFIIPDAITAAEKERFF